MKQKLILSFFLFLSLHTFGQSMKPVAASKKNDIVIKINQIKLWLNTYQTLSPFSNDENRFGNIDSVKHLIVSGLLEILNDKRIVKYKIDSLLQNRGLDISKSDDNRIYFFSLDEKNGGTYQPSTTILHYRLANGSVKAEILGGNTDASDDASATSNYDYIVTLDKEKNIYLAVGGVTACGTCIALFSTTIQLDSASFTRNVLCRYDGRSGVLHFEYDEKTKTFNSEYYAEYNDDSLYGGDNDKPNLKHRHKQQYKFMNYKFELIENSDFWDETEKTN